MRRVRRLASCQVEGERMAVEIGLEMDLGREAAARAAKGLIFPPPFAPAAKTWARIAVLSNIWTRSREALRRSQMLGSIIERLSSCPLSPWCGKEARSFSTATA